MTQALIKVLMILIFALSFYYIQKRRPDKSYILLFIPSIFLLPANIFIKLPSFVYLNCYKAALLPLIIWAVFYKKDKYRFEIVDMFILLFIFMLTVSKWINYDSKVAMLDIKEDLVSIYGVFVVSKIILSYSRIRDKFIKIFISSTAIVSILAVIEFFTGFYFQNLFRFISFFILVTLPRWGFNRSLVFTSHPIILGIILSLSIILSIYMYKKKGENFYLILFVLNILGIISTLARGPIAIGVLILIIVIAVLNGITYKTYIALAVIFTILYFAGGYAKEKYFVKEADSHETASVQYRTRLYSNYKEQMYEKPLWGYGNKVKVIDGQKSIDNYYLQTSLAFGIPTAIIFIMICLISIYRSVRRYKTVGIFGILILMVMLNYLSVWDGEPSAMIVIIIVAAISGEYLKRKNIGKSGNFERII